MAIGWYYAHDQEKLGPFSVQQLKDFAACGEILPTDTVWKEGVEAGVPASRVRYLFALPPPRPMGIYPVATPSNAPSVTPAEEAPSKLAVFESTPATATPESTPENVPVPVARPKTEPAPEKKRGTATALKGAVMAGQDGVQARYRMKCMECGHQDSSCRSIKISNRTMKSNFFCPKCKKRREVIIQCRQG